MNPRRLQPAGGAREDLGGTRLEQLFAEAMAANAAAPRPASSERDRELVLRPKVLSVWQPWAWLVIFGPKRVENRKWLPRYTGPLLIQVAQGWERERFPRWDDYVRRTLDELEDAALIKSRPSNDELRAQLGHVIGRVELTGTRKITTHDGDGFGIPGLWGWELESPSPITPYVQAGKRGLTDADRWVLREPQTEAQAALNTFYKAGMRKFEAPVIALGERMSFGELFARVAEDSSFVEDAAKIREVSCLAP